MARWIFFSWDLAETAASDWSDAGIRWARPQDPPPMQDTGPIAPAAWERMLANYQIVVAERDDRIVGQIFCSTGEIDLSNWLRLRVRPTDVFSTDAFVLPEFRGQRLIRNIKLFAGRDFAGRGYRHMVSWCRASNTPSVRAHLSLGARKIFSINQIKIRGFSLLLCSRRPWIGIAYGKRRFAVAL